jgi:hypothetical protein
MPTVTNCAFPFSKKRNCDRAGHKRFAPCIKFVLVLVPNHYEDVGEELLKFAVFPLQF